MAFVLSLDHLAQIAAWRREHGCRSASQALRQIIEAATARPGSGAPPAGTEGTHGQKT